MRGWIGVLGASLAIAAAGLASAQQGERKEAPPPKQEKPEGEAAGDTEKADPRKEKVKKLLDLRMAGKSMRRQVIEGIKIQMPGVADSWFDDVITDADLDDLMDIYVPIYEKAYTDEELDALLAFYDSPIGRAIAKKETEMVTELVPAAQGWGMKIGPKLMQKMMREDPTAKDGEDEEGMEEEGMEEEGSKEEHKDGDEDSGKASNETSAIGALRTLSSVQAQFREGDRDNDNILDYATSLVELSNAGLVDNVLGSGKRMGYVFSLTGSTFDWQASATPESEKTGARNFVICSDGVVRFSKSEAATCTSPAIR